MTQLLISGLTTVTTINLFEGCSEIVEDIQNVASWFNQLLPKNNAVRGFVYISGGILLVRSLPIFFRNTSFFQYFSKEFLYFHHSSNEPAIIEYKKQLLSILTEDCLPLYDEKLVILELNIGGGTNLSYYPQNAHIIGTDVYESSEEHLEANTLCKEFESVTFCNTSVEELHCVADESVSCVVSFHSLCGARIKERALREILRVLLPGGRLIFIEHVLEREMFTARWWSEKNFSINFFMLGCCPRNIHESILNSTFSSMFYRFTHLDLYHLQRPMQSLSAHVYGYAVK